MIRLKHLIAEQTEAFDINAAKEWIEGKKVVSADKHNSGKYKIVYKSVDGKSTWFYFGEAENTKIQSGTQFLFFVPHGYGTLIHKGVSGWTYAGYFINGIANGYGEVKYSDGDVYKGEWKDSKYNGYGEIKSPDGYVYKGKWKLGFKFGYGEVKYSDGDVYKGEWKDSKYNGYGVYKFNNGDVYKGEFKVDLFDGYGELTYANGEIKKGKWKADEFVGSANEPPTSNSSNTQSDWYKYPNDKLYIYQQRDNAWWAKNIKTNKEYNISANPKYKTSVDSLNTAATQGKLIPL